MNLAEFFKHVAALKIPRLAKDANGNVTGLRGPDGETVSLWPIILAQSTVPMILPSSGTIGDNGALTLTTALPAVYSNGCYMYFPANAISAGSDAGIYYVVMSSTTAGTIYNNTYTGGVPTIPASPTPFVTTGPGAYTQTTGEDITVFAQTIPANTIGGVTKYVTFETAVANSNGDNNKTRKLALDGQILNSANSTTNTTARENIPVYFANNAYISRGSFTGMGYSSGGAITGIPVNTTIDNTLTIALKLESATGFVMLLSHVAVGYPE